MSFSDYTSTLRRGEDVRWWVRCVSESICHTLAALRGYINTPQIAASLPEPNGLVVSCYAGHQSPGLAHLAGLCTLWLQLHLLGPVSSIRSPFWADDNATSEYFDYNKQCKISMFSFATKVMFIMTIANKCPMPTPMTLIGCLEWLYKYLYHNISFRRPLQCVPKKCNTW